MEFHKPSRTNLESRRLLNTKGREKEIQGKEEQSKATENQTVITEPQTHLGSTQEDKNRKILELQPQQ